MPKRKAVVKMCVGEMWNPGEISPSIHMVLFVTYPEFKELLVINSD
jgi:hypothetical protein